MKNNFLATIIILIIVLIAYMHQKASAAPAISGARALRLAPSTLTDAPKKSVQASHQPADVPIIEDECISIEQKIPDDLALSGVWVINKGIPYLENLDEHTEYIVPLRGDSPFSTASSNMTISPDGTHMAYIDQYFDPILHYRLQKRILRVIRSSGHALDMSFWDEDWQWLISWVNNQEIAIMTAKREIVILNPITGNWRKFQQPGWLNSENDTNHYYSYWDIPSYNPTLEWVLDHPSYESLALKNVQTGETVWRTNDTGDAAWAANSSTLAVISKKSIYIINNGKQEAEFDIQKLGYGYIYTPSLSSNGQKLAFNGSKSYADIQLSVFDVAQRKLSRLCADGFKTWGGDPIWSPDNRFVLQEIHNSEYDSFDVLIDTQEMRAYLLHSGDLQHRIVWLAKP